jgi:phage shock protein PspC (stress-responsive transcriptional regulator)
MIPPPWPGKRLYRSLRERMMAGICGGLSDYLNCDPTLIRVAWVASIIFSGGMMLLVYFVLIFIIPNENEIPRTARPV